MKDLTPRATSDPRFVDEEVLLGYPPSVREIGRPAPATVHGALASARSANAKSIAGYVISTAVGTLSPPTEPSSTRPRAPSRRGSPSCRCSRAERSCSFGSTAPPIDDYLLEIPAGKRDVATRSRSSPPSASWPRRSA